jgi:hypothetical protein
VPFLIYGTPCAHASPRSCPRDLELMVEQMLTDIPAYANRIVQSQSSSFSRSAIPLYVIIASRPDFRPLPLSYDGKKTDDSVQQVFFTTLEHQYGKTRRIQLQNFYWLLLTRTSEGWKLVSLYTQLAKEGKDGTPLPPQETSNGIIGQAVRLWLRDCQFTSF